MKFEYRQYQEDCEDILLEEVVSDAECHPVAALPTGSGKSKILASFIYKYLEKRPSHNILIISHTQTILQQDYIAIQKFFPDIKIGLYSSGLNSRTTYKITVAGIQSIYKKGAKEFSKYNLAIIDEAHSIPTKGNGRYRQFFDSTQMQRIGLTGTHFRTGHGYIHKGKGALFNKLVYDLCTMESFNKLVTDGYLCELYSKPAKLQLDVSNSRITGGDFNKKDLSQICDRHEITTAAIQESLIFGKNYKSWLVFAIDINHANHIAEELCHNGINAIALHSKSEKTREEVISKFKNKEIKAIVSVGMITTGFDAPNIDLIILLRPTNSPVLHVQMIGRGSRIYEGKTHCLVLDFAGNVQRLGPINNVKIPDPKKKKKKPGEPIVKKCPDCGCLHHPTVRICNICNHKFKFKQSITTKADNVDVIQKIKTISKWLKVTEVFYSLHSKKDRPVSLKVTYKCGLSTITEYVCYDHAGYAKYKAINWVKHRNPYDYTHANVKDLYEKSQYLQKPKEILIETNKKYPMILGAKF